MELLFDEMIQETLDQPKSEEDLQKLRDFYAGVGFLMDKITAKAERLDDEHKKKLFHKVVAHLKQIHSEPFNQVKHPELKSLLNGYIHQLKKLRSKLRSALEGEVVDGASLSSKTNIGEVLDK